MSAVTIFIFNLCKLRPREVRVPIKSHSWQGAELGIGLSFLTWGQPGCYGSNIKFRRSVLGVFIGMTDVEAETPILWPPHAKS